jgi:membrane fusion protein (multidrug efflux system)
MNTIASPNYDPMATNVADKVERPRGTPSVKRKAAGAWRFLAGVVMAGVLIAALLFVRSLQFHALAAETDVMSVPTVQVIHPRLGPATVDVSLPGNLTAYSEASIYARTNGYLKAWYTDFGAQVKEGQLMAEISAPDVDAQLNKAKADLAQSKANLEIARLTYQRQKELLDRKVVSQQEYDQSRTTFDADDAAVKSAEANVQNLTVQQNFEKIIAPFPGIVTKRGTDVGDLIAAGSDTASGSSKELFHIVRTNILRVFVQVPQVYASQVSLGTPATVQLIEFPGETFSGKIANISGALDPTTRTLTVEVQVPNPDGRLYPGAYGQVQFTLPIAPRPMIVPAGTLLFRKEGMQVGVVESDGRVQLKSVTIGRDFGTTVEVVSGLQSDDRVISNPSDSLATGTAVHIAEPVPDVGTGNPNSLTSINPRDGATVRSATASKVQSTK